MLYTFRQRLLDRLPVFDHVARWLFGNLKAESVIACAVVGQSMDGVGDGGSHGEVYDKGIVTLAAIIIFGDDNPILVVEFQVGVQSVGGSSIQSNDSVSSLRLKVPDVHTTRGQAAFHHLSWLDLSPFHRFGYLGREELQASEHILKDRCVREPVALQ